MPSPLLLRGRRSSLGAVYMVTTVTVLRQRWLAPASAAQGVEAVLRDMDAAGWTASLAWVVMPDHLHWLFALQAGGLSSVVQRAKSCAARSVNAAHARSGAVWQAGFYDRQLRADEDLRTLAYYILANPVRSGLAGQVGEYPYAWCYAGTDP